MAVSVGKQSDGRAGEHHGRRVIEVEIFLVDQNAHDQRRGEDGDDRVERVLGGAEVIVEQEKPDEGHGIAGAADDDQPPLRRQIGDLVPGSVNDGAEANKHGSDEHRAQHEQKRVGWRRGAALAIDEKAVTDGGKGGEHEGFEHGGISQPVDIKKYVADPQTIWMRTYLKKFILNDFNSYFFKENKLFNSSEVKKAYLNFLNGSNKIPSYTFFTIFCLNRFMKLFKIKVD